MILRLQYNLRNLVVPCWNILLNYKLITQIILHVMIDLLYYNKIIIKYANTFLKN